MGLHAEGAAGGQGPVRRRARRPLLPELRHGRGGGGGGVRAGEGRALRKGRPDDARAPRAGLLRPPGLQGRVDAAPLPPAVPVEGGPGPGRRAPRPRRGEPLPVPHRRELHAGEVIHGEQEAPEAGEAVLRLRRQDRRRPLPVRIGQVQGAEEEVRGPWRGAPAGRRTRAGRTGT